MYTNLRHIVLLLLFFCFGLNLSFSQIEQKKDENNINSKIDSITTVNKKDLNTIESDTTQIDSTKITKEFLEANIIHKAKDYTSNDFINEIAILYDEAELYYQDIELKAGQITIDYKNSLAYAKGIYDSVGNYIQKPVFKQAAQESTQDSLIYNFKNEKAIIYNSRSDQQGVIILGKVTKKENDSTYYVNQARFTSSQKENPDYYIQTSNIKVIPDSKIVGGWSNLVIADVPTPLFLPFFFAPITSGRSSGILLPTWGENSQQGYFLQNGGFYFNINDYLDLAVLGDIYTNGSWGVRTESNYSVRYKFSGNFSFRFENLINSERGFPDFSKRNNFFIRWSHSQAAQSNPNGRFSASVNFGSSQFYRQSFNELSSPLFLNNTFSSSINYSRKFTDTPFNMNISLTHTQNTNTKKIDMSLPSLNVNMDRVYPFAPKVGSKKNALQNIGLTYTLGLQNRLSTTDEDFLKPGMFDEAKSGIKQDVSMGTNLRLFKYFTVSPNLNYKEVWYLKTIDKNWNEDLNEVIIDTLDGFDAYREYSTSASLSTTLYGMFKFKKGKIEAIRHVIRPSVSYGYRPDFGSFYDEFQASSDPNDIREYNRFQEGVFGGPSRGLNNSIGMSLSNNFEAKMRPNEEDDPEKEPKKVKLLNNLNFSTSYNMAADSLRWSPVQMSTGAQFFDNKLSVNVRASMDPYAINVNGSKINTFNINNGGSLFRLTNAGVTSGYSIKSSELGKNKNKSTSTNRNDNQNQSVNDNGMFGKNNSNNIQNSEEEQVKQVKIYDSKMPWDLRVQYSLNYTNRTGNGKISSNSVQVSGNIEFSPKWKVGISSGYDFENKGITYTQLRFERDLDSWRFSFNWIPFGNRSTYYFFIGVKSGVFSDLKYDKRKTPDKRLF